MLRLAGFVLPGLLLSEAVKILTVSKLGECLAGEPETAASQAPGPGLRHKTLCGFPERTVSQARGGRSWRACVAESGPTAVLGKSVLEKTASFLSSLSVCSGGDSHCVLCIAGARI